MNYCETMNTLEREAVGAVSSDTLMEYTRNIAQWVRITSLPEERKSLGYVESVLKGFGYRTQMLGYDGFISYPIEAGVRMETRDPITLRALAHCFTDSTGEDGVTAPVSFDVEDCEGSIVLMDGLPNYGRVMGAKAHGAVAVIFAQDRYLHNMPVNPIWGSPTSATQRHLSHLPVVSVTRESGETIRAAAQKGEPLFLNVRSKVEMGWKKDLPILIADLPAKDSNQFVLLSCHIDSWDYGAMDNGSANATAMECARVLAQYRDHLARGIRVAFWSGHSQGKFCGSSWYADTHYEELEKNCIAHVNIDSTGGKGAVVIDEPPVMPHTRRLAAEVIREQTGSGFIGKRIGHFADQSFFGVGLSSVFGTFSEQDSAGAGDSLSFQHGETVHAKGLGWWWHTEHDTVDKVDPQFLQRDTRIYLGVLWRLATAPVLPFDFSGALEDMTEEIQKLQKLLENRFDFSPLKARIVEVGSLMEDFTAALDTVSDPKSIQAKWINRAMQKVAQCFVRVQFHSGNVYDYDLGTPMTAIPSLECAYRLAEAAEGSDDAFMLSIEVQRGMNRVMHYLSGAAEGIKNCIG